MSKDKELKQAIEKEAVVANAIKLVKLKAPKGAQFHAEGEEIEVHPLVAENLKAKGYK